MALWIAWATMASAIQLSFPALEISSVYNPFSSRFSFPVAFHRRNAHRFNGLHTIPPFLPPSDHAHVQELAFTRIKLFKTISTLQMITCKGQVVYKGNYITIVLLL